MLTFGMLPAAYLWNRAPFVRLLFAQMAGIGLQWHLQFSLGVLTACLGICFGAVLLYSFLPLTQKFAFSTSGGAALMACVVFAGAILVWTQDIRHHKNWVGHAYRSGSYVAVTLKEPLVEKPNSYKALARFEAISTDSLRPASGQLIIYFKKDASLKRLGYGSQIVFKKPLQEIKNAGNPGSFDYKQYSLFQGITHQVYLTATDFELLPHKTKNLFEETIFNSRTWLLNVLKKYIRGVKEQGLAEALLIGYKDDLDKNLVQAYSNTGVVHVIAISGLHLGLIYWLLLLLTRPFTKNKHLAWPRQLVIVVGLWSFSLLAGGQPSVLRSAVMFSCMALGEVLSRKTSIYNTLALSAFLLLCYNPYWLWDVGFQLSYAAVASIIMFFRPVYNWFYFSNKLLDFLWKLNAVTIAAQLLTLPVSVYHFHQIPTLLLFTNMLAVPLSSIILIGEIILCALFFLEPLALGFGNILTQLIYFMNTYIERFDSLSFSVWNGLSISIFQTLLLWALILAFCSWLMEKKKGFLWVGMVGLVLFLSLRLVSFVQTHQQKKLIVYNVPRHQAIDLVVAHRYYFIGDSAVLYDDFIRNFHLQPSRIQNRTRWGGVHLPPVKNFDFYHKRIALVDSTWNVQAQPSGAPLDLLILSGNPRLSLSALVPSLAVRQIVIDGSVPAWKARLWRRDCDSLGIPCHDVGEKGAFVLNL